MKSSNSQDSSSQQDTRQAGQRWLEPKSMMVGGVAVAAIGLLFNWNWIVAVGIAPLLFVLPCMLMMGWMMWSMRPKDSAESTTQQKNITQTSDRQQPQSLDAPSSRSNEDSNHA
jgi:predicted lipid-binding transport protein (Tim44 family)